MKKISCLLFICIFITLPLTSCSKSNTLYEQNGIKMDTFMDLKAYGPNAKVAVEESFKKIDELDKMASPNISTSDVSKINNAAGKEYIKVHPEIMKMIKTSIKYSKLSNGAWDITTGPLIKLWGIGTENEKIPSDSEIKAKLPLVGYDKISINEADSSVMLQKPGMSIDLGGIAKGFTCDEVLKIYKKYNIKNGLINLGNSSIYAVGKNESNSPWSVAIQHPRNTSNSAYLGIIKISDKALSTSGDYERYFIKNGKRYHHIINPFTGYPTDNGTISDTIVADGTLNDNSMICDLLSTTVFILGREKGIQFVENLPKVDCEITTSDYNIYTTSGLKDKIQDINKDFKYVK
ncbi:FAD:protein FMN transferase [Clostridium sp. P21]|uniref:FAD:protein FMN transferase n=1 Tax=Clostridium muellerianum TaxID=2716538 RepID=A0A7Y0EHM8_9CLOT|nr:FAD:protein FMN transferase [Clostridium muellerianum]NMM63643.1 FAD:protein FMN transferase [Clostridium muellerianum]